MNKEAKIFVTVKDNAGCKCDCPSNAADIYNNMLYLCRGKEVEIETKYLFLNQLNTAPIENVSENGLRLFMKEVENCRLVNCTFDDIQREVTERYKKDWNMELTPKQFSAWRSILSLSEGVKPLKVWDETEQKHKTVWGAA